MDPCLSARGRVAAVIGALLMPMGCIAASASGATRPASPYPRDALTPLYERAAEFVLRQPGTPTKGYCLVFGAGEGRLAYHLAIRSRLRIIGIEPDKRKLISARKALHRAGLYGDRIALHEGPLTQLRYRGYVASLVVSDTVLADGVCSGSAAEMFRMVRPDGGIAIIGQPPGCPSRLSRQNLAQWLDAGGLSHKITEDADGLWACIGCGPLDGAGEWTHMWGDLGNTACSRDRRTTDDFSVLWFGEPGPSVMVDRHWEPVSPLYKNGRFIVPGFDRIVCCDAYNGARLWDLVVPNAARIGMMRDAGWLALGQDILYAAVEDKCLCIDVETGRVARTFRPPHDDVHWGYIAIDGNRLFGSEQIPHASYLAAKTGRGAEGNQLGRGDDRMLITSKALFCQDAETGKLLWTYTRAEAPAVIANPTICVGDGAIYFFESRDPAVVSDADGRVPMADFAKDQAEYLVKLDKTTGKLLWRHQRDMTCRHVFHLSYAKGILVASGCTTVGKNYWYHLRAYHARDGSVAWQRDLDSTFDVGDKNHGKQDKHPLIIGETVQLKQGNFDLFDGTPLGLKFSTSNCADCAASMNHVFTRNRGVAHVISLSAGGNGRPLCSAMRPGCYISIIPAGGVIMLPAFSAGCTCNHTIQTTITWLPR